MAAQAIFVLIDGRKYNGDAITGADSGYVRLRGTNYRWNGKRDDLVGAVGAVTIDAGGVAIIVEHGNFSGVVKIGSCWQWVAYFRHFSHHIRRGWG